MASIVERKNRLGPPAWRVKVRRKGYPPISASFKSRAEAERWGRESDLDYLARHPADLEARARFIGQYRKRALSQPQLSTAKAHTVAELCERFTQEILPSLPKSRTKYGQHVHWWSAELGPHALNEPGLHKRISESLVKLSNTTTRRGCLMAPATVRRFLATLSSAFSWAVRWDWADVSPIRKVIRPPEPRWRVRYLSRDRLDDQGRVIHEGELTRLRACRQSVNPHLHCVVMLALYTGMRSREIVELRWSQVDTDRCQIYLAQTKGDGRRLVPLKGNALELIREKRRRHAAAGGSEQALLFPGPRRPDQPAALRACWLTALRAAGIQDFKFHDLRHTYASYLMMGGASMLEVSQLLGHSNIVMTQRYSHLTTEHLGDTVERVTRSVYGEPG